MKKRRSRGSWPIRRNPPFQRLLCAVIAGIFSVTTIAWADGGGNLYALADSRSSFSNAAYPAPGSPRPADLIDQLDESAIRPYGEIQKRFHGSQPKTMIYIQDAHANLEAQQNIAGLLDYLAKRHGLSLVHLEGSTGHLKHELLSAYPDPLARRSVAEYFLKEAKLTGPEFLAIASRPELTLYGIENKELYDQNPVPSWRRWNSASAIKKSWKSLKRSWIP